MPDRPSLSVVLLNYNHGYFLTEALNALIGALSRVQGELIVVDDASTDDSLTIIERFLPLYPSLRLVARQQNQGVVAGMNEGLRLANNDYIYFAASDDRVTEEIFLKSLDILGRHPEAALCSARASILDRDGQDCGLLQTTVVNRHPCYLSPQDVARIFQRDDNWLVGNTTIYRRDLLLSSGGFRPELGSFCDGFASRLLAFRHGVCFLPDALAYWRRMSEGYSQSETADMSRVERIADTTAALFRGPYADVFPPDYARRWRQRWLFGARAHALYGRRVRAERRLEKTSAGWTRPVRRGLIKLAWAGRLIVLFMRMRPFDVLPTLQRRLGYMKFTLGRRN